MIQSSKQDLEIQHRTFGNIYEKKERRAGSTLKHFHIELPGRAHVEEEAVLTGEGTAHHTPTQEVTRGNGHSC